MRPSLFSLRPGDLLLELVLGLAAAVVPAAALAQQEPASASSTPARRALARGDAAEAIELATVVLRQNPQDQHALLIRANSYDSLRRHKEAVEDYDALVRADSKAASLHHLRGRSRFKLGDVDGSIADFDRAIELQPALRMRLWERGISLYYAESYAEGARQFEQYQQYDASDVENVVWRYLCQARAEGVEAARQAILPLDRDDPRVPMMTIYALYRGEANLDDVLAAARAGSPGEDELRHRLFYAHLYLGLYFEAASNAEETRRHLQLAHRQKISHYMWDVAHVHLAERGWLKVEDASTASAADEP